MSFLYALFYCVVILLAASLLLFWRNPPSWVAVPREYRSIALLISVLILIIMAYLTYFRLSEFADNYNKPSKASTSAVIAKVAAASSDPTTLGEKETEYISNVYKPLLDDHLKLKQNTAENYEETQGIRSLIKAHPSNKDLLEKSLALLEKDQARYQKLQSKIVQEITNAYIHASVQNADVINKKFSARAAELHKELMKARESLRSDKDEIRSLASQLLIQTRERLSRGDIRKKKHSLSQYSEEVQKVLIGHRKAREAKYGKITTITQAQATEINGQPAIKTAYESFVRINVLRNKAVTQRNKLMAFYEQNVNLRAPLKKTMELWKEAEQEGLHYLLELLNVFEVQYLAQALSIPAQNPNLVRLDRELNKRAVKYLVQMQNTMSRVERSFNLPVSNLGG